jgi:N-acetylmuramoyl-L-alanine amidase
MSKIILAADSGHGFENRSPNSYDPGVVGAGVYESRVALAWALTLKEILPKEFGIKVVLTRESDTDPTPLTSRTGRARRAGASHFLSLHCNGAPSSVRGTETLYRSSKDLSFAYKVQKAAMAAMKSRDRGYKRQSSVLRGSPPKPQSLYVLNDFTSGPAALCELGFLSNAFDRARLLRKDVRIAFARALGKQLIGRR